MVLERGSEAVQNFKGNNAREIAVTPHQRVLHGLFSSFNNGAFHPYAALRISGKLNEERLFEAAQRVVNDNDALRTRMCVENGMLRLFVYDSAQYTPEQATCETVAEVEDDILKCLKRNFSEEDDSLFRLKLYRLPDSEYVLLVLVSHIVSDGDSIALFVKKLFGCYVDMNFSDTETTGSLAEYNAAELKFYSSEEFKQNCRYWQSRIAFDECPNYKSPKMPGADGQNAPYFVIDMGRVRKLSAKYHCTSNMLMMCAYHLALCKMLGKNESKFFFMYANRTVHEYSSLIAPVFQAVFSQLEISGKTTAADAVKLMLKDCTSGIEHSRGSLLSFSFEEAMASRGIGFIMTYSQTVSSFEAAGVKVRNFDAVFNSMEDTVLDSSLMLLAFNEMEQGILVCPLLAANDMINKSAFICDFTKAFLNSLTRLEECGTDEALNKE